LINGGLGINTVQMTSAVTLTDADFAHMKSIEVLGLNGVSASRWERTLLPPAS